MVRKRNWTYLRDYGEEKQWRQVASVIVRKRDEKPIKTTRELKELLSPLFAWKKKGINPLTLVFRVYALRLIANLKY